MAKPTPNSTRRRRRHPRKNPRRPNKRRPYRERPVSTDLVVEARDKEGQLETFTFPKRRFADALQQIPMLRERGYTDIKVTNAA